MFKIFFENGQRSVALNCDQTKLTMRRASVLVYAARGGGVYLLVYRNKENQPDFWALLDRRVQVQS
jgi:hypothetical protein